MFDAYWPGGTKNTAWWKNISGLLTEVASVRFATPVRIEPNELSGGGKGLVEYGPQTNFPNPWPGGEWRLRDIMDYERIASDAILETCAERRADFLRNALERARAAIATYAPRDAFRIPADQRDTAGAARLAALLAEHGVELKAAPNGDVYVPLAQPYGRFVNELLTAQRYPETKLVPGKDIVRPYDVSAWTLPLMMGVTAERATLPPALAPWKAVAPTLPLDGSAFALAPGSPETTRLVNAGLRAGTARVARAAVSAGGREWPAGTVFLDGAAAKAAAAKAVPGQSWTAVPAVPAAAEPLRAPRVGLYKPWAASMDEGWTRFVLEQYGFEPKTLDNKTVRAGGLLAAFDVDRPARRDEGDDRHRQAEARRGRDALLPRAAPRVRGRPRQGRRRGPQGLRREGRDARGPLLLDRVRDRRARPARPERRRPRRGLRRSPVRSCAPRSRPATPSPTACPPRSRSSRTRLSRSTPCCRAPRWSAACSRATRPPRDVLLSGWMRGPEAIARKAAAVALTYGKGKVVLLGFRAQHRAQTPATFPFLFDALYWSTAKE